MKPSARKLRSPLKWHGGKSYLARRIIGLFPEHRVYIEPFFGGGSVLLNKPRSKVEVVSDLNWPLVNFWKRLKFDCVNLGCILGSYPYSAETFQKARDWVESADLDAAAAGFMVRNRMSRGGLGRDFAWSDRMRGGQPGELNAWSTMLDMLPAVAERMRRVHIFCEPAERIIRLHDVPDAVIYCDPPYVPDTRSHPKAYACEMSVADHESLLQVLLKCRGHVYLSGYRSELYDRMLAGWTRHEFDMPNHSGQGKTKQRRTECLWVNR